MLPSASSTPHFLTQPVPSQVTQYTSQIKNQIPADPPFSSTDQTYMAFIRSEDKERFPSAWSAFGQYPHAQVQDGTSPWNEEGHSLFSSDFNSEFVKGMD